jgi:hypothetical protein
LLPHGWWFSPGPPAAAATKTDRHDIAESGVEHQKINHLTKQVFIAGCKPTPNW